MSGLDEVLLWLSELLYKVASSLQLPIYERYLTGKINRGLVPQHVALVLDGNRRFAASRALSLEEGYRLGAKKVEEILDWCDQLGIRHVTLYSFSLENFSRSRDQIKIVLGRIKDEIAKVLNRLDEFKERGIRVRVIGRVELLPEILRKLAREVESKTSGFGPKTLNLAIAYGGRAEILDAVKGIAKEVRSGDLIPEDIDERVFRSHLYLNDLPDPDLIIRTSGEERISNFLLWHMAYSELYFCEAYLPTFRKVDFLRAIRDFQGRNRRRGA